MDGILVIDKPPGPTSFDVVHRVRALLKVKRAGHTGTLDPAATGVLPICLGEATKLAGFLTDGDKAYDAVIRLGLETDTLDAAGQVTAERPVPPLSQAILEEALSRFRGSFLQVPPMYSAVKVHGRRLYELARAGEQVDRAPRPVTVHELKLMDFSATELTLSLRCSKGFFVRSLALDLGRALGTGGHLKALRRTRSGPFSLKDSIPLERLVQRVEAEGASFVQERLLGPGEALSELPEVRVAGEDVRRVLHGVPLEGPQSLEGLRVRVMSASGALLAMAEVRKGRLRYLRVLQAEGATP